MSHAAGAPTQTKAMRRGNNFATEQIKGGLTSVDNTDGLPQIDSSSHKQDSDTWPPQFSVEKFEILHHRDAGDKQTRKGLDRVNT
jgi:hypothetical protein